MNPIQKRCSQVTWGGYPRQSCTRPARKMSRNCNLKRTKRSHWVRLRDKTISSRFVDKLEESGELRSRLVSRGYESSHADPASLIAATPSVVATRIAFVLGLAQDVEMAVADISGAFLHAVLEKHVFVTLPAEYRKPGVVWKIKRYLYGDKRAPRGWQDHFEKTVLELGFERLESEPGCFVKKGDTHKDTIIVVVHVDDLLSVGKRKHLNNFFVQLEKTFKLKRVEFIENGKSVCCAWVITSQSSKTRSLSRARIRMWTTCSRCWAWRVANQQAHRWCERSLWQTTTQKCWKAQRPKYIGQLWAS